MCRAASLLLRGGAILFRARGAVKPPCETTGIATKGLSHYGNVEGAEGCELAAHARWGSREFFHTSLLPPSATKIAAAILSGGRSCCACALKEAGPRGARPLPSLLVTERGHALAEC